MPFTAIRREDSHTPVSCTIGNRVIEVNRDGQIVWTKTNEDLGDDLLDDAFGVQRLSDGNTVTARRHADGDRAQLCEVMRNKKLLWEYPGMNAGFHHFQIPTTNGHPIVENAWE